VHFYSAVNFFTYLGHASQSYTPIAIVRTAVKKTSKGEIETINYQIDNVNKGMSAYAATKDFRNKRIVTRLVFRDHLESYLDTKVIFDGFIQSIVFEQRKMTAFCIPKIGSLNYETGWPYQIQCNAKFGDAYCKVSKNTSANRVDGWVMGGSAGEIVDLINLSQPNDYWNWGAIIFTSGANNGDSRKITDFDNASKKLTLDYVLDNAPAIGDTFTLYRGCDKTLSMCQSSYVNDDNFHGFHSIPLTK